ncbi:MAG TPA: aminotransferase class I/II-fold pyridoxal phosphate-dependent enzyme [Candidatus Scybalocola faecigallinarum]|uniref:Aminotransferase n=1 Tax=Candidatus Scybalocola faecigallinarum TaxID=2840941 RepID=A0A9D1JPV0_9FIRM|nr:aminotransferase class I/II-fold pyridoxal phosphate-dependent enzyme [Candidatus Scybalocola faecigallinarum]
MRNPLSKTITEIKPSGIRKFFDLVTEMNDPEVISLGVGEPDFDTPWFIREEGIYSLEKGRTFYTSNSGLKELREEICNYLERHCHVSYDYQHEVLVTVGGSEAIDIGLRAMLDPGDEVLIPQPSYVSYEPCTILAGGVPVIINLKEENEFRLTKEDLLNAITPKTKVLIMPFPNNPTGAIMERKDLEAIAQVCIEKDIFVMSDEIYSALTYGVEHVSIASLPGMKERTILINGFSKGYAMTGWRLGYACGPKEIIEQMTKIHQFAIMCAPTTSQYAAVQALKYGDDEVEKMRQSYDQRRKFLIHTFRKMGLECFEPFGAFYIFPSIKSLNMSSDEFAQRLLQAEKVAVVPGTAFGDCGEGFLRISYAYSLEELKTATDRIARFVAYLKEHPEGEKP